MTRKVNNGGDNVKLQWANSFRGNKLINNFTAPISPFASSARPRQRALVLSELHEVNVIALLPRSPLPNGTAEEGATNFITVVNPSSSTRRLKGTFPLAINA